MKAKELAKILMITPDLEVVCMEGIEEITVTGKVDTVELFNKGDFSAYFIQDLVDSKTLTAKEDFLLIRSKKITDY